MKASIHKTLLSASLVLSAAAWAPSAQAQLEPLACGQGFCASFDCTGGVEGTCCGDSRANTITCTETDNGCLIEGFGGADVLTGSDDAEGDIICAGSGDDFLSGLDGNDALLGQAGNDVLNGGAGDRDVCAGGPDTDTADPSCEGTISVP